LIGDRKGSARVAWLERWKIDRASVEKLSMDFPWLHVSSEKIRRTSINLDLRLEVTGVSGIDRERMPILAQSFRIRVRLSREYPQEPPLIETRGRTAIPFHPQFRILRQSFYRKGIWRDSDPYDPEELLAERLLRVAQSLVYLRAESGRGSIANSNARDWFRWASQAHPTLFPTDSLGLGVTTLPSGEGNSFLEASDWQGALGSGRESSRPNQRGSFRIERLSEKYKPEQRASVRFVQVERARPVMTESATGTVCCVSSAAIHHLREHIGWGNRPPRPIEQGGLLLGRAYLENAVDVLVIVEEVVPSYEGAGTAVSLQFSHQDWKRMLDSVAELEKHGEEERQVVGWYHTHPGHLDVFMSETDRSTQRRVFREPWHVALVLNPQKRVWAAFSGRDAVECPALVFETGSLTILDTGS
jgi:proteasome lid subunit RPN8/RPN11